MPLRGCPKCAIGAGLWVSSVSFPARFGAAGTVSGLLLFGCPLRGAYSLMP